MKNVERIYNKIVKEITSERMNLSCSHDEWEKIARPTLDKITKLPDNLIMKLYRDNKTSQFMKSCSLMEYTLGPEFKFLGKDRMFLGYKMLSLRNQIIPPVIFNN